MKSYDYLIIGGGVSGVTAAETLRENDEQATIAIVDAEANTLYSRVQIPHYIKGVKERSQIFLRSSKDYDDKKIDLLLKKAAISVDTEQKIIKTNDASEFTYKKLLLTTGGTPKKLNKHKNELYMHTIEDADALKAVLTAPTLPERGIVIGSGFIATELVEAFKHYGLETHLCVAEKGFWANFLSPEVSSMITKLLSESGVIVHYGDRDLLSLDIDSSNSVTGVGIGLDVSETIFSQAGVKFDGGLVTDEFLKTNVTDVFASGDVVKFFSKKLNRQVKYGNWSNALVSGRFAALNMLGLDTSYDQLSSYSTSARGVSIVFLGFSGMDEKTITKTKVLSNREAIQFFIREGKLDGCILINRALDRKEYSEIIEARRDFNG
ncbi:MAG: NAD(P)/FAD-dependent oxidoreductase [Patescibacteria group bacterium]